MSRKVYVFIDAANLWEVQKTKGRLLDFKKLLDYLKERYKATELKVFYTTQPTPPTARATMTHPASTNFTPTLRKA